MNRLEQYKEFYNKKLGAKEKVLKDIEMYSSNLKKKEKELKRKEKALELGKLAAINTQKELEFHISSIVTTALDAVFDDPYEFEIDFVDRRGKTECDLWFVEDGNRIHPLSASGLGAVDIAAFALKIASLSMSTNLRQTLLLDEPFRYLSTNYHEVAGEMVKTISKELGIQIIMISHSAEITSKSDKVFKVTKKNKESSIEEL